MSKALISHPYVETYIEIIAGYCKPDGSPINLFDLGQPLISLARYDMKIVPSLARQSLDGLAYTDKQASLAVTLVLKYERQLIKHGISVEPVRNPQFKQPLRAINRVRRLFVLEDKIILQFPFIVDLVEQIREYSKISKGKIVFDHSHKYHVADLTEHNLNWLYTFAKQNDFDIDSAVEDLMTQILNIESQSYSICLSQIHDKLQVKNAADSLNQYITDNLGGYQASNLLRLVDYAPVLGYSVDNDIKSAVIESLGSRFWQLCANRMLKVDPGSFDLLGHVIDYAKQVGRYPIYVFEPDLTYRFLHELKNLVPDTLLYNADSDQVPNPEAQVIYMTKLPKKDISHVPLLISSAGMLFGVSKTNFLQAAEKVVYFTQDVYNKHSKGIDICRLD